jgi:hypothetical protein
MGVPGIDEQPTRCLWALARKKYRWKWWKQNAMRLDFGMLIFLSFNRRACACFIV